MIVVIIISITIAAFAWILWELNHPAEYDEDDIIF